MLTPLPKHSQPATSSQYPGNPFVRRKMCKDPSRNIARHSHNAIATQAFMRSMRSCLAILARRDLSISISPVLRFVSWGAGAAGLAVCLGLLLSGLAALGCLALSLLLLSRGGFDLSSRGGGPIRSSLSLPSSRGLPLLLSRSRALSSQVLALSSRDLALSFASTSLGLVGGLEFPSALPARNTLLEVNIFGNSFRPLLLATIS